MADSNTEMAFVGAFWSAAQQGRDVAWKALSTVQDPAMLEHKPLRCLYALVADRHAAGLPLDDVEALKAMRDAVGADAVSRMMSDGQFYESHLVRHAQQIVRSARARAQVDLLRLALEEAEKSTDGTGDRAKRIADRLAMRLLDLHSQDGEGRPQTRNELLDDQLARMDRGEDAGVRLPWPKLESACGPWMPGDLVGVCGYSGTGKSLFAANLAMGFARSGVPVIVFPTEMRERWLSRALASVAGIPQWRAEKEQWASASADERIKYRTAIEELREWPWEIVNRANITPVEIMASVRVLRRRWESRTVVVIIDHLHRLDYGSEEPNVAVGGAARLFKNFASDLNVIVVALLQPKKPAGGDIYRPIPFLEIRGAGEVGNELDTYLSPFRQWVKLHEMDRTPWGTAAGRFDLTTERPVLAKPESDGAKLDDEHVYLKPGKLRVGGEAPSLWLDLDAPSGSIYEHSDREEIPFRKVVAA